MAPSSASPHVLPPPRALHDARPPPSPDALPSFEVRTPSVLSQVIYVSLAMVTMLFAFAVVVARTDAFARPVSDILVPWELSILVLALLVSIVMGTVVARATPELYARRRQAGAHDPYARWELPVLFASVIASAVVSASAGLVWAGYFANVGSHETGAMAAVRLASVGILLAFGPYGYFSHARERHVGLLEDRFPDFLRDLNESHRAGLTMAQAIRVASRGDYGKLNPDIRRMAQQVSWGTPFHEALRLFAERVPTPVITRAVALIIKATRAGGNVGDVLSAAARDARELKALQKERKMNMTLYVIIVYIAFGVFLAVTTALGGQLIPSMLASTRIEGVPALAGIGGGGGRLTLLDFKFVYLGIGLVQALGSGIVAGVMSEGTIGAGLKHSSVLVAITIVALGFF